tara:strand:+ start:189 stop:1325 length:1137 start_codon:yes stop_codon:yes gene_type:complete
MANLNFDLDRLLTGVSSRPMEVQEQPIPGSSSFSGDFGAQTANSMKASLGKLVRGGRPTQAQQLNQAEAKYIAGGTIEDKKNLIKILVMRGKREEAAKVASEIKAMQAAGPAAAEEKRRDKRDYSLEERKVAVTEAKAETARLKAAEPKIYKPDIIKDATNNSWTAISTDPATLGAIISQGSTLTQAQQDAAAEVETQKRINKSQQLIMKRNTLIGQAKNIRSALKEANEEAVLPVETGFAIQKASPLYGAVVGKQTYQKLADSVASVQSAEALNSLADLKAQSSTGSSGLGATNAMEFSALQDKIRRLNPDVPSTIEAGLQAIERHLDNIIRIDGGLEPIIDWDDPAYAHMVQTKLDGSRAYSYDGNTWYNIETAAE